MTFMLKGGSRWTKTMGIDIIKTGKLLRKQKFRSNAGEYYGKDTG